MIHPDLTQAPGTRSRASFLPANPMSTTPAPRRFRVALSFPGEHEAFVAQVAESLATVLGRTRVFYYRWYEAELARLNLDTYLQGIYRDDSDLLVVFICRAYEKKKWCRLEWRAIRDLINDRNDSEIMPIRVDDGDVTGLFSMDGYVDVAGRPASAVAQLIQQRLELLKIGDPSDSDSNSRGGPAQQPARNTRQEHRDKIRAALSDELDRYAEDPTRDLREIADTLELEIRAKPAERARLRDAIVEHLLDKDDSIPLLNKLIRGLAAGRARDAVKILENCMDLILPFHFSPEAVASAADCLNQEGGGVLPGVVMTKCGAELVMAAQDRSRSQFERADPDLRGIHARQGDLPALGKISIDDDVRAFLASIELADLSGPLAAKHLKWYKLDTERTAYCIVRLPEDRPDRDHALKVLQRASESLPLPILVLSRECKAESHESLYLAVLRRRFSDPQR
jgi:hypothetical protein